jgi:hypothetical protein
MRCEGPPRVPIAPYLFEKQWLTKRLSGQSAGNMAVAWRMILKSGNRFSEKIMRKQEPRV